MLANYSRVQFMHKKEINIRPGGSRVNNQNVRPIFQGIK
jgi:hypothetical protein